MAYKPLKIAGEIHVYYSTIFGPYKETLDSLKAQGQGLAEFFSNGYQVWIGYHAILQENAKKDQTLDLDPDKLDAVLDDDRVRVATMQVKQAVQTARLRSDLLKAQGQADPS